MPSYQAGQGGNVTGGTRGFALSTAISLLQSGSSPLAIQAQLRREISGLSQRAAADIYLAAKPYAKGYAAAFSRNPDYRLPQDIHLERANLTVPWQYKVQVTYTEANTGATRNVSRYIDSQQQLTVDELRQQVIETLQPGRTGSPPYINTETTGPATEIEMELVRAYCRNC